MEPVRCPAEGLGLSTKAELPWPPSRTAAWDGTYRRISRLNQVVTED